MNESPGTQVLRLAVLSDTHGLLRPELIPRLAGVDAIIHGGDIGGTGILDVLANIAPTSAVRGNIDKPPLANTLPETLHLRFAGAGIYLIHDLSRLDPHSIPSDTRLIIFGHSHKPASYQKEGRHYLNPGSVGPRRFKLPISFAILDWSAQCFSTTFVEL